MWICLKDGFLSLSFKYCKPDQLMVRARVGKHITNVFPDAKVKYDPQYDYHYTAIVSKDEIVKVISERIMQVGRESIKSDAITPELSDAYYDVWEAMERLQDNA